jgi:glycosyltransferase involved in cell wall biosynthesis
LRIAYVANSHIPSRAANTVHVLNMSSAFRGVGAEVSLIARAGGGGEEDVLKEFGLDQSIHLELAPKRRLPFLDKIAFVHFVRTALRRRPVEFAYGRSSYGLLLGVPRSVPVAYEMHTHYPSGRLHRIEARLFRQPNFLFATAISRALAAQYESDHPVLRGRILVAPCAATLAAPPVAAAAPASGRPLRVYYVGHLYPGKGAEVVLAAAERMPDVDFHIVGGDDADIAALSARAPSNVTFHGYVAPAGLAAHFAAADVCVAPYQERVAAAGGRGDIGRWMSPMKVFEYMAYGKPIVASDLPVLREVLMPEVNALLCPPNQIEDWCNAIARLRDDPALRKKLADAGRRDVEEKYNWHARAGVILGHARSLLAT